MTDIKLKIIQTADPVRYKPMLDLTRSVNQRMCFRHKIPYEAYYCNIRGGGSVMATFNRIYLMLDHYEKNNYDWIMYLDADILLINKDFDPREICRENINKAFVFCSGGQDYKKWDVNIGVFYCNLKHPMTKIVLDEWRKIAEETIPADKVDSIQSFHDLKGNDDQSILQRIFQGYHKQNKLRWIKNYHDENHNKFNYDGVNVRQFLRPADGNFTLERRIENIQKYINTQLRDQHDQHDFNII